MEIIVIMREWPTPYNKKRKTVMSNIAKCHLVWKGKGQGNRSFPSKRINISPFTKDFRRGEQDNEDFRVRPNQRHTHAITLTRWPEGNEKRGFI